MMNKLLEKVKVLADEELKLANEQYPLFASAHEGAAVILEEVEEADDEMVWMKRQYNRLWDDVKADGPKECIIDNAEKLKRLAKRCAAECIQVAAMCEKMKMSEESRKEN